MTTENEKAVRDQFEDWYRSEGITRDNCATVDVAWGAWQAALQSQSNTPQDGFQQRVKPWMTECFGPEISSDTVERNHRFLEESLELVQACGCTQSEAHQLVDYVYGRPVGEKHQEVGGVMVTLAALCLAQGLNMHEAGEIELARIWTKVEKIRAKQAAKPKHSPLPQHVEQEQSGEAFNVALLENIRVIMNKYGYQCRDMADEIVEAAARLFTPTPTSDQAGAQEAVAEVVEYGVAHWIDKAPPVGSKLYLTPPTVDAAVEAFRLAAMNVLQRRADIAAKYDRECDQYEMEEIRDAIRALPGSAKALEDVCMEVAKAVSDDADINGATGQHREYLRAIVQSVIRKG